MRKIFVAATEQNAGKTTVCLGLYRAALARGWKACFIKPVGQRYLIEDGEKVDEDAVLFKRALGADGPIKSMNPISIPRGFTESYIFDPEPGRILATIKRDFEAVSTDHDFAVIEGTGHAGVGSVLDASNAAVAKELDAHAVIVSGGGIGRCIDEICLNRALFNGADVPLAGAVVNKVYVEKYDRIKKAVSQGLKNNDINCLGVLPYREELSYLTAAQIRDELELEVLCGEDSLQNRISSIIVAAMAPQNMVRHLQNRCLVVVPGDRIDNILASINAHLLKQAENSPQVSGLLLTGGFVPHVSIVNILCEVDVPVLLTDDDTATAAFKVRSLVAKITQQDTDKIEAAEKLVSEYVDVETIFEQAGDG